MKASFDDNLGPPLCRTFSIGAVTARRRIPACSVPAAHGGSFITMNLHRFFALAWPLPR
jgi:hypothetical protein